MKLTATLRPFAAAALLLATTSLPAAATAAPASAPTTTAVADNPAAHPNFSVRVVGKGAPMVLIPGLTCPGAVWDETVARYQKQYQCHIVSLAGFGGAAAPASTDSLLRNVRDQLLTYIQTQKLSKPVVVGHSLGGFMALWLSTTRPEAVGPLVIVDSLPFLAAMLNPDMTVAMARPMAANMRQQMTGKMPVAMARQMSATMMTDTARISQAMYDLYTTDLRAELGRIRQPVLVLGAWAAYKDYGSTKESTKAIFERQYAALPGHRVEMSEAGRHFLMYDDTAWFFQQTDAFLKQSAAARK
ncbi:alpha/beta hydrolase [Hymenobacter lapidiphilus]|uniref:alpha/beta fold hydrolase n=1 Tax=Hymenobacter sp. CCM 8763 TaxID=2303334 RepID=UPI000E349186|nr:alpha/beta hydrolase [Hymenobacter sp. CCM 8763]RFP65881.1 alpha/beta hydrolase [Hymenobacter sp. CCM 8763]